MIEVRNVSKKYGNFYAVRDISFDIKDGEIVGFLGRNGAGKTTTMNMITGFIEPTSGEIVVNGYDVETRPKKVKKLIGYMPEGVPLYSDLTVKEFISYMADLKLIPHKKKKEAVEKAIMETGLEKVKNRLTRNLSRGFKQRVSMAGSLVGDPEILILDEPTVGLDPKQVKEIRELIKSFRKNHTVILSSHILSEVSQICEKVIIIDKGEIVAVDTPENLEAQTQTETVLKITVEDPENSFEKVFEKTDYIEALSLDKINDDQTKIYTIRLKEKSEDIDARKDIAIKCAENNILNLGIKKEEQTLEDAFMKLIDARPDMSYDEISEAGHKQELDELREEKQREQEKKEIKKEQKSMEKEEKQKKKAEKKEEKKSNVENQEEVKETSDTEETKKDDISEVEKSDENKDEGGNE